jgi:secreted trypsin-like serine protease
MEGDMQVRHPRLPRAVVASIAAFALLLTALVQSVAAAPDGDRRIIGGQPADFGEYPFMVALLREDRAGTDFDKQYCGGSLIASRWVLTAAHCVDFISSDDIAVAVSRTNLDSTEGVRVDVRNVYIHPDWDAATGSGTDVALIELAKPVRGIEPIQLAAIGDEQWEADGALLTVIGWGNTSTTGHPNWPDELRELQVPVVSDAECDFAYGGAVLVDTELCAGDRGVDSCQGDSGGPLFGTTTSGDYVQVGIVSWGFKCGKEHFPGVYAEVNSPLVRNWIRSVSGI